MKTLNQPLTINNNQGMALVVVLLVMVVVTVLAVGVSTSSRIDVKIAGNHRVATVDFFVAEGGNQIEVPRISTDNDLAVSDITNPATLDNDSTYTIASLDGSPTYQSTIRYHFYQVAIVPGFSLGSFNLYVYSTQTDRNSNSIETVESKIGPQL
ncbi:MAG: hypothetical protein JXO49_06010 [Deltaproteobacteria bacterium]|nr:hypothetical protein [Candidatus Anaeroferrophillus wilburensis]MBN2888881.1 hypothetical protein [Deltaproteobacteria bacterium]